MGKGMDVDRRHFLGGAAMALIANRFGLLDAYDGSPALAALAPPKPSRPGGPRPLGPIRQIDARYLGIAYAGNGPSTTPERGP